MKTFAVFWHRPHGTLAATAVAASIGVGYAVGHRTDPRQTAVLILAVLILAVLVLAWLVAMAVLVPWRRPAAPRADQRAALA